MAAPLAGCAGVRDGSPVVGATPVALTAGDWFWTAAAAAPIHRLIPRCPTQALARVLALL